LPTKSSIPDPLPERENSQRLGRNGQMDAKKPRRVSAEERRANLAGAAFR